jgi:peptidyl-prolyl cis-trans isomerase A (cyclophilin A)
MRWITTCLVLATACSTKSSAPAPQQGAPAAEKKAASPLDEATEGLAGSGPLVAEIATELGTMRCTLHPEAAPETVASFVGLARGKREFRDPKTGEQVKRPFFDGLLFHRVIPEFMIQGGDPQSIDPSHPALGTGGPGYTVPDEVSPNLRFDKGGMLAMANKGPGTRSGGSQFFITEGPVPRLDGGYAIFGTCDGVDVVKAIARVPRGPDDRPEKPVTMKVTIKRG